MADMPKVLFQIHNLHEKLGQHRVFDALNSTLDRTLPKNTRFDKTEKIVKDVVWGITRLPGYLTPIIDSRLFQRLRRIRQLGFSYLVYPSAGYSRFEHSIGCFHIMSELINALKRNIAPTLTSNLNEVRERQLRLGALIHDIGHMPFSHASEKCLDEFGDRIKVGNITVNDLSDLVEEAFEKKLKLAEIITTLTLLSDRFREFLVPLVPTGVDQKNFFFELAAFVAGARLSNEMMAFSQILSGPLDADRLDYMARDSYLTGIPISIDVARLLHRCNLVKVAYNKLPKSVQKSMGSDQSEALIFATDISGTNALEELAISRFILYDRVYYHQKTRSAEALLGELLHGMRSGGGRHFFYSDHLGGRFADRILGKN